MGEAGCYSDDILKFANLLSFEWLFFVLRVIYLVHVHRSCEEYGLDVATFYVNNLFLNTF
jgi:hypothetical protein